MSDSNHQLIPLEKINALEVFTENGIDELLDQIKNEVTSFVPDVTTAKGRQEIKSTAYKVTLSKGVIENAGKELVADWVKKTKTVNDARRQARDFLTELAADVRKPLTEYEAAEAAKARAQEQARQAEEEQKRLAAELDAAHSEALVENELFDTRRKLEQAEAEKREAEQAELEKRQAAEAEEREFLRREELRMEAEAKAKREVEERAKREQAEAVEAERKRMLREQEEREAERKRIALEEEERERKRQEDAEHRRTVHATALAAFVENDFTEDEGKRIITVIFQKKIPSIYIQY